jgi:SET domain-containing protein
MLLIKTTLRPSAIEGIGLFAAQSVPRGTPIWRFVPCFDQMLPPSFRSEMYDAEYLDRYAQKCPFTGFWILCGDDTRFMNHADEPNVACRAPLFDPALTHDALRNIESGEELTCDYRIGDTDPFYGFAHDVTAIYR